MTTSTITEVIGRRIWDSRGRPTVEAEVVLANGTVGRAIAPAGASIGSAEAIELRDVGEQFGGYDVRDAVKNVQTEIAAALQGLDAMDQAGVDRTLIELDGTAQKSRLGANAIIAVSMAVLQAAAAASGRPLYSFLAQGRPVRIPLPEIQIFGGGAHAGRRVDIQDFLVVCPSASSIAEALDRTGEVYQAAGCLLRDANKLQGVADEGGWWPTFASNEEALDMLMRAVEKAGFTPGDEVSIALDVAASDFGRNGRYILGLDKRELDRDGLAQLLLSWIDRYPILSIEDPFGEDDPEGFRRFTAVVRDRVQVVGDDLLVTDAKRVCEAAREKLATCVLIKPNQAGTVSETFTALEAARKAGLTTIISARSGETEDTIVAHLAVGWDGGQIKVGSIARGERTAKWNELLRIEAALAGLARFAGWEAFGLSADRSTHRLA